MGKRIRWSDYHKNPCLGECQGKGWVIKDGKKDACPDCYGTQCGLLPPPPDQPNKFVVTPG
ncbi:MAG: hypothetical protein HYS78_00425 [Parcubacteria group bacterium]|nr:hypothetical protein [Parcubacteria group bacterium]